jgi:hypothetical protein
LRCPPPQTGGVKLIQCAVQHQRYATRYIYLVAWHAIFRYAESCISREITSQTWKGIQSKYSNLRLIKGLPGSLYIDFST